MYLIALSQLNLRVLHDIKMSFDVVLGKNIEKEGMVQEGLSTLVFLFQHVQYANIC